MPTSPSYRHSARRCVDHTASHRFGRRVTVALLLEVAEHCARIAAEVARGLGPVAVVECENLVDVVALELVLRLGEREDLRQRIAGQAEVIGADHGRLAQYDRLLAPVLELAY